MTNTNGSSGNSNGLRGWLAAAALAVTAVTGYQTFSTVPAVTTPQGVVGLLDARAAGPVSFRTHDGTHYLRVYAPQVPRPDGRAGQLWADSEGIGVDEQFTLVPAPGGFGLRIHDVFVSMQPDGTIEVNRPELAEWEVFRAVGAGLQSLPFGLFLSAEEGGGQEVGTRAYDRPQAWEEFAREGDVSHPQTPPATPTERHGRLRLTPQGFADDAGPVLPLYAHFGNALSLFARDEAMALAQLDDVAAAGYQGIRYWQQLGCGRETTTAGCPSGAYWRQWVNGPDVTAGYWDTARRFAQALQARGLRAVVSQGDINQLRDRCGYMRQLAALDQELGGFIDFIDAANEGSQTGESDERALARFMECYATAGGGGLRSLTSGDSEGTDDVNRYAIPPSHVFDIHSFRGGRWFDKIRHIFSAGYDGHYRLAFGIQSEPAGNGPLVTAIDNREELDDEAVPLLAVASLIGRQAFVWFSGEGVVVHAGLKTDPGFATTPRAVAWLPRELLAWPSIYHSGASKRGQRILAAQDEARIDCREGDGRAACIVYGPSREYRLAVERGFVGRLCNPGDGVCSDVDVRAGQTIPVSFTRGRVLVVDRFQ